ncbi:MAG: hypothetical protein PVJ86_03975 [Phycisphaerales bacterium]|jgi:hypothetical protein
MPEIWTAAETTDDKIIFEVKDEQTEEIRIEECPLSELPEMLKQGGTHPAMAMPLMLLDTPWRFRKVGTNIYLDGPSIGAKDYHPIDREATP